MLLLVKAAAVSGSVVPMHVTLVALLSSHLVKQRPAPGLEQSFLSM